MWWIIVVILAELLAFSIMAYLILKRLEKREHKVDIEKSVCKGVKSAIKELEEEKEQEEETLKKLDRDRAGIGIFSSLDKEEEPINTKDLIPVGLSESEKELLRMFYNQ